MAIIHYFYVFLIGMLRSYCRSSTFDTVFIEALQVRQRGKLMVRTERMKDALCSLLFQTMPLLRRSLQLLSLMQRSWTVKTKTYGCCQTTDR
jgi:hypothetical protein